MQWKVMLQLIFGLLVIDPGKSEPIKRSEYNKMPKMFEYDYYDDCLYSDPEVEATYCLVRVVIKPDSGSELWRLIESFSSNRKLHMNHAALDRGICIYNLEEEKAKLKDENFTNLVMPKFNISFPYIIGGNTFRNVEQYRANYSDLLSVMINKQLIEQHGLRAYTEIEYCDRTGVNEFPIDNLDITFLIIVFSLIALMILSSWFDYSCKLATGLDHYCKDMHNRRSMLLASFSVIRNWYRLTSHSREPINRDLRVVQSVRYHTFCLVLIGHASILVQSRTGWVMEQKYRELPAMIVINGFQVVSTFFAVSALVFTIMYVKQMRENGRRPGIVDIILVIVNRYIRLTPVYALLILFEATWFIRLQDGPFWRRGVETGLTYCRRNWWINLLYFNNYYKMDEPCMQHSWYMACEFQLSAIGVVLVTLIIRLPKIKVPLLASLTTISLIISGVVVYTNSFEGVSIFSPEARRFIFWYDEVYQKTYLPTHMNLTVYICGIIIGMMYLKAKSSQCNLKSKWYFRLAFYSIFLIGPGIFLMGQIFYTNDFPKPSIWMSIYFSAARLIWGLLVIVCFFGFVYRVNKPITRIMNIRLFEVLGRLTYGAYIGHFFIIKMMFYNSRELSNMSEFDISVKIHATLYLSFVLSLALALFIELPISALQKQLLAGLIKNNKRNGRGEGAQSSKRDNINGNANGGFQESFKGSVDFQPRL